MFHRCSRRVPLDKDEGVVKAYFIEAVREHRAGGPDLNLEQMRVAGGPDLNLEQMRVPHISRLRCGSR